MYSTATIRSERGSCRDRAAFWISVTATTMLLMTVRLATIGAAGFILLGMLFFLAWPKIAADVFLRTVLPWMFPLVAVMSVLWSQAPIVTLRIALEWLATTGIAIILATSLPAERLLASWMLALIPVVIVGGVVGGSQFTETGEVAAIGIFGSKNNFALHVSEMFFVCMAVLSSTRQRHVVRLIAVVGILAGPALLWRARSVGALVVFLPSLLPFLGIVGLGLLPRHMRRIAVAGVLLIGIGGMLAVAPVAISARNDILSMVGKTSDLTGRGLLWQRAQILIAERPLAGVGYAAFWQQGNPEAEALWRAEHIPGRAGFHFHSFYYETLVELGYVGMTVGLAAFALVFLAVWGWALRKPGPESGFFCAMMVFLLLRSFVELDLLGGFDLTAFVLPSAWVYSRCMLRRHASSAQRVLPMQRDTSAMTEWRPSSP